MRPVSSVIQIIAELVGVVEKDQVESVFVLNRLNDAEKILALLPLTALVAALIDQPGNPSRRSILLTELVDPNPAGADEIHPPVIMWLNLVFFPLHQRGRAG